MRKASRGLGSVRAASIALLGLMVVTLSACGNEESSAGAATAAESSQGGTSTPVTTPTPTPTPTPAPTPAPAPAPSKGAKSVTLAWTPPTLNSDGTPLTDLTGYKIHYGPASQDYTGIVALNNAGLTRYVVSDLPAGNYYFAVAAYNSKGIESNLSQEVSATLD